MADVFRLAHNSLLLASPLILPFQLSPDSSTQLGLPLKQYPDRRSCSVGETAVAAFAFKQQKRLSSFKVHAAVAENADAPKWWEKNAGPNMIDVHSTEEFINALSQAGDKLLCKTAEAHPDILFLKVNFDENKPMCKRLNVRVLPYFHFYRGADGRLESFSCSIAKFEKIKDAIETHNTAHCSIGPPVGVGENLSGSPSPNVTEKPTEASPR